MGDVRISTRQQNTLARNFDAVKLSRSAGSRLSGFTSKLQKRSRHVLLQWEPENQHRNAFLSKVEVNVIFVKVDRSAKHLIHECGFNCCLRLIIAPEYEPARIWIMFQSIPDPTRCPVVEKQTLALVQPYRV